MVLGGGEIGDDPRFLQWQLALPHILSKRIVLGHGLAIGGQVVGYQTEGGVKSLDSYVIGLLVETGLPGCLLFFAMIAIAVWVAARLYVVDCDRQTAAAGALACSLIAFATYRFALYQEENHTLMFIIISLIFAIATSARRRHKVAIRASSSAAVPQFLR